MVAFFEGMGITFWSPLVCFCACMLVYVLGEWLSRLTNGSVSSLMFSSIIFLLCFWAGIFPADITTKTGMVAVANNFITALLITNLGTLIDLEDMLSEWKTVAVALAGICGIAVISFTVGSWIFGRDYALMAAPPISGGTIAGILCQAAANDAGRPELAAYVVLVLAMQKFFGMPVATIGLKKVLNGKLAAGEFDHEADKTNRVQLPSMRLLKPTRKEANTSNMYFFKLAAVAVVGSFVGQMTKIPGSNPVNYYLNPNIAYLIFGLIFTRIGFLDKQSLQKSGGYGMAMMGLMLMLPGSLANVTPSGLLEMLVPLVGMLGMCTVGICALAVITGKLVGYDPWISAAIACTCMFGYPGTEILSNEVVNSLDCTDEQRQRALEFVMPKMIVGGFTTVTVASVVFAGIICPMIFA